MVYRKGERSKSAVGRGWPHQVAVQSAVCVAESKSMQEFCAGLSLCVRGHCLRRADEDYQVRCFSERELAELFAARFVVSG
jgi:hypothetical protein